jgi:hypothetical protein
MELRGIGLKLGMRGIVTLVALLGFVWLGGCFEFEKEATSNAQPRTFFDFAPPDTTFANEVSFRWIGTDLDSDVVAYQYSLVETDSLWYYTAGVEGSVVRIVAPTAEARDEEGWSQRGTDNFEAFALLPDGWYEMRARSIDDEGAVSVPAVTRFYVFFDDIAPEIAIVSPPGSDRSPCGRIGSATSWIFWFNATDDSRSSSTPRSRLQYSYQLRSRPNAACAGASHSADAFTPFQFFPDDGTVPVAVGNALPTLYTDLFSGSCGWIFTLRIRDPAGNTSTTSCCISQTTGCQGA